MTDTTTTDSTPKWLKAELFEDLLSNIVDGYKQINSFNVLPGIGAGENYAAVLLRLEFEIELQDGESKSHSFMLKIGHDSQIFKKMLENHNFFVTEFDMYMSIIPELEQLYRDVGVDVRFGAKGYEINAPADYVLLENLTTRGFKNANRLEGLDMEHTESVLRKLAQWHAASAVRVALRGPYSESINIGFYTEENRLLMTELNKNTIQQFLESAATYKGIEEILPKIKVVQPKLTDLLFKTSKVDPNNFNVLNHGDCWSNNVMFQYDAFGKIKETYLIDHQIPNYGSVAQDLLYFLLTSPQLEIKLSKFDYFIKYYHDNLIEHLTLLKYNQPMPKLRDIHASLYRYGFWGYGTVTTVMGTVLLEPTGKANFDSLNGESADSTNFRDQMFTNARYRKHIEALLPWLYNRGAIDF